MMDDIINNALREDLGDGDYSSLSCIPKNAIGSAQLIIKSHGVLAGVEIAKRVFNIYDSELSMNISIEDGSKVKPGDIAFVVSGRCRSILATERLVLNFMQRMSGIASQTRELVDLISHTNAKLLDTRKTTPGIRSMEKRAVKIGGGHNHRFGLYDMIMLKDNHIDFAGGIKQAIEGANKLLEERKLTLKIEIEVRNLTELKEVLEIGKVNRIMLDNFTPTEISEALKLIPKDFETEASGGINRETIIEYAETGVDYISVGSLTHRFECIDMSLKADFNN